MISVGDFVGRYQIQAVIGQGGCGQVYRAWDPELDRAVAIKELAADRRARDPAKYADYQERFKLERRVQGQFQHPRIMSVYDLVQHAGAEYLVQELGENGTLRDYLDKNLRLPPERVVEIGIELCQAIAVIWERDIVHRDLKPGNIFLMADGHVKLGDFGIAQIGHLSQRTQADTRHPGTPAYMAPEQEGGGGYLDDRADMYAVGLVLYEALTGKSYKRERVPVRALRPDVPPAIEQAIMRALRPDRAERYASAAEFEMALRRSLTQRSPKLGVWLAAGGIVGLVVFIALGLNQLHGAAPAPTSTPTLMPTVWPALTGSPLATTTPVLATASATVLPTATPIVARTPTRTATVAGRPAPPRLISPPGASQTTASSVTFQWDGILPDATMGFQVNLHHEGGQTINSAILAGTRWSRELPAVGEWRWTVAIVRRSDNQVLARSEEWTLYYNPFPAPFLSPLNP